MYLFKSCKAFLIASPKLVSSHPLCCCSGWQAWILFIYLIWLYCAQFSSSESSIFLSLKVGRIHYPLPPSPLLMHLIKIGFGAAYCGCKIKHNPAYTETSYVLNRILFACDRKSLASSFISIHLKSKGYLLVAKILLLDFFSFPVQEQRYLPSLQKVYLNFLTSH